MRASRPYKSVAGGNYRSTFSLHAVVDLHVSAGGSVHASLHAPKPPRSVQTITGWVPWWSTQIPAETPDGHRRSGNLTGFGGSKPLQGSVHASLHARHEDLGNGLFSDLFPQVRVGPRTPSVDVINIASVSPGTAGQSAPATGDDQEPEACLDHTTYVKGGSSGFSPTKTITRRSRKDPR